MPIVFTSGVYQYSTLIQDAYGYIHLFEGMQTPSNHPTLPKVLNKEADIFLQSESDVAAILDYLTEEERMHVAMGYAIQTKNIPDDYFMIS